MLIHDIQLPWKPVKAYKPIVVFCGDLHWGSPDCSEDLFRAFVKEYSGRPHTWILLLGDMIDAIALTDKRFLQSGLHVRYHGRDNFLDLMASDLVDALRPLTQRETSCVHHYITYRTDGPGKPLVSELHPVRHQIIGEIQSNHHFALVKSSSFDPGFHVRESLQIPYLGVDAYVRIKWLYYGRHDGSERRTLIKVHHGTPSNTQYNASRAISAEKIAANFPDADVVVSGHTHDVSCDTPIVREYVRGDRIFQKAQYVMQSGTFKRSRQYDGSAQMNLYQERRGLRIKPLGWSWVEFSFHRSDPSPQIQPGAARFGTETVVSDGGATGMSKETRL